MTNPEINLVILASLVWLCLSGLATLFIVVRIFVMHNVKNSDGSYSWIMPTKWFEAQEKISETQEKISGALLELSEYNKKSVEIMQNLANSTLLMHQELVKSRSDGKRKN